MKFFCILLLSLIGALFITQVDAAIYYYKKPDGTLFITNQKTNNSGYTLQRSERVNRFRSNKTHDYFNKPITSKYEALISQASSKHGVDPALTKAIIHAESAFNPKAVSKAGAQGLMQLMPTTAKQYSSSTNYFNAENNITIGVKHLAMLKKRYNGDKRLILAAYNAGEAAVAKYKGIPPFAETQQYVTRVQRLYTIYAKQNL